MKPRFYPLKTTPAVQAGKARRKNRSALTPNYWNTPQERPVIDRQRPGRGFRHVLLKRDVERFIAILPEWGVLSRGLNAIVLAPGRETCQGWHRRGVVAVCAWSRELAEEWSNDFVEEHRKVLQRLDVPLEPSDEESTWCHFTEDSVRGFQLMHVLLHELGHHQDRITTRSEGRPARGEGYAEMYANAHAEGLWRRYFDAFGW
jgi:hypothetical protein